MSVKQRSSALNPWEVAIVGLKIIEGDVDTADSPGVKRIVEQANYSAGRRPEQHICFTWGDDAFDGGNERRTIPNPFPAVGSDEVQILTDYSPRSEYRVTRFGFVTVMATGTTGARYSVTLTDESANSHTFTITCTTSNSGVEQTSDVDLDSAGLNVDEWIEIEVEFQNLDTTDAECRMFRVRDLEQTSSFPEPEDD